jgi:flagellar basal-body rod modification protein FlgD
MASGVSPMGPQQAQQSTQQANFLDDVEGTGQDVPADRKLESSGEGGFNNLGTQDFLDLLITQMQNQNPRDPMKSKEMMGQISQLTQLKQTQNLSDKIDQISTSQKSNQYISLIGANVSVKTQSGETHSGQLSKVSFKDGGTQLKVGGTSITSSNIQSIGMNSG